MAGHRLWSELRSKMTPAQRSSSDALYQKKRLGLLLAEMRKNYGMTQTELAERLGIGQSTISQMESSGDMHVETLKKIVTELEGQIILHMPSGDFNLTELASD